MLNNAELCLLALVRSALDGTAEAFPEEFSLEEIYAVSIHQQITPIIYVGALNCGFPQNDAIMEKLFVSSCHFLSVGESQRLEMTALEEAFQKHEIDYLPLKGDVLKNLYPERHMRTMADIDILIRKEQYQKIKELMLENGYSQGAESDNERHWFKGQVHIELHIRLFPSYDKELHDYFGSGWERAKRCAENQYRHEMSAEDLFIFLFVHFTKHYRYGGIGLRQFCDLWIYRKTYSNLNEAYILEELKKLHFDSFYLNVKDALAVSFLSAEPTVQTDIILDTILSGGAFGTAESGKKAMVLRATKAEGEKARFYWAMQYIFLPYRYMCVKYPFLKKLPFLLPVMWPVRWITVLLFKRNKLKRHVDEVRSLPMEDVDVLRERLKAVGLSYHAKE